MHAHQIMSREVLTVSSEASIADAIATMLAHHISGLPVVDFAGNLVGMISEGDFIRRAELDTEHHRARWLTLLTGPDRLAVDFTREHGRKVGDIMTPDPITISEDTTLDLIVTIMETRNIKRLPVMRGDQIVGMVTRADFLPAIARLAHEPQPPRDSDERIRSAVLAALSREPWHPRALNVAVRDGSVILRGVVRNAVARKASIVAAGNVNGVRGVEDHLCSAAWPPPEEEYGGDDMVSLQEEAST